MSKYFHAVLVRLYAGLVPLYAGLVLLYVFLTAFAFLLLLRLSGVYLSNATGWLLIAGWCLFCFFSSFFSTAIHPLIRGRIRQPILEEENKLRSCLGEVLLKAGCERPFCLKVGEYTDWDAFALGHRTIVVTRGMLAQATDDELKGVLAHQLGHLVSKDTLVASAFVTAGLLPRSLITLYKYGSRFLWKKFFPSGRSRITRGILLLVLAAYLLHRIHLLPAVIPALVFVFLFSVLNIVFNFFRRWLSRCIEYRQDAYAHRLGYGPGLRQALQKEAANQDLQKEAANSARQVNPSLTIVKDSHPVIYNRIRRLEKLEGLRA